MSQILRFKLKRNYRDPISIEAERSIFKGRENDLRRLKNLINFRKSAAVLVSGVRGVGKTAFVHEVLRQIKINEHKLFSTVELTFANLPTEADERELRKSILKGLIRGLYLNKDASEKAGISLEKLYDKTFYSELSELGFLEKSRQETTRHEENSTNETVYKIDLSPTVELIARVTGSAFSLLIFFNFLNSLPIAWQWWQPILVSLVGGVLILLLMTKIELKTSITLSKGLEDKLSEKLSGSRAAKYDLSADTLEAELKQILKDLEKSGAKAIFVIDELDKLDQPSSSDIKDQIVYKIVKTFKNFFSLSSAIFIFITSSEFFDLLEGEKVSNPYSTYHTIFTDRIFLTSLYHQDIENVIDGFADGEIEKEYTANYKKFKSFISWKAKNHIFDTHNLIEEYTVHDESGESYVSVFPGDNQKRGNIEEDWEIAASLQVYIAATYDEKTYPTNPRKNEILYLTLRTVAQKLYDDYGIDVVNNNYLGIMSSDEQKSIGINDLNSNFKHDLSGAIEDFLRRTEKFEFTSSDEETKTVDKDGVQQQIKTTSFGLVKFSNPYPDLEEIRKTTVASNFEKEFILMINDLEKIKDNLTRVDLVGVFEPYQNEYNNYSKIRKPIEEEKPRKRLKSQILNDTQRVKQITDELKSAALKTLIQNVVSSLGLTSHGVDTSPSGQSMRDIDPNLAEFFQFIQDNKKFDQDYVILSKDGKHLLIGFNFDQNAQDEYLKISKATRNKSSVRIMNILQGDTLNKRNEWRVFILDSHLTNLTALNSAIKSYFPS